VCLGVILAYYVLLVLVVTLSEKKYMPGSLVFWIPNILVATIGIYLFTKMVKK
jgi:lipopolysaccharide export LptBFGC system permease protein LptF